jgi:hypothetical protein
MSYSNLNTTIGKRFGKTRQSQEKAEPKGPIKTCDLAPGIFEDQTKAYLNLSGSLSCGAVVDAIVVTPQISPATKAVQESACMDLETFLDDYQDEYWIEVA